MNATVLNTNIGSVLNTKIREVDNKTLDHVKYITTQKFNNLTAEIF